MNLLNIWWKEDRIRADLNGEFPNLSLRKLQTFMVTQENQKLNKRFSFEFNQAES